MKITRLRLYFSTTLIGSLFVVLSWHSANKFEILNIIGFGTLITIPGLLTILSLRFKRGLPFWFYFSQIIGLSILEILLWTLLCNTVLPHLHVIRPLDRRPLLIELSVLYSIVLACTWRPLKGFSYTFKQKHLLKLSINPIAFGLPIIFLLLSISGALSLNNGGSDFLILTMLIGMSFYIGWLLLRRHELTDNTIAWSIYMIGLSLLLMTSLRGWYITGHDIQQEFEVFQLTKRHGLWNIADLRDPYNACLSITVLPTVLANTLHVADPYVFKVFFQLIFASVPVLIYLIMRRYLSRAKALLAVIYFIAFPTYFTDMPFLNRQEIAFLFLALMLLVIHDQRIALLWRRRLFMCFGLGMILSHYSTTYSWIFILLCAALLLRPIYHWLVSHFGHWRLFNQPNIADFGPEPKYSINLAMVGVLVGLCFIWNTVLTNTSNDVNGVIASTIDSLKGNVTDDVHSSDVSYSLFSPVTLTPTKEFANYVHEVVDPLRKAGPSNIFYPSTPPNVNRPTVISTPISPLTWFGRFFLRAGVNVSYFNYFLKQTSAKLLQVFVLIGIVYTLFKRRLSKPVETEYLLLAGASLFFVALQIGLPYLSEAYGLLRAFQQSLMLLGLFLVIGTFALTSWSRHKLIAYGIPVILALVFFLTSTGVVSQLIGGYQAQLHLNNSGQYYDLYYTHAQEIAAVEWLNGVATSQGKSAGSVTLQADSFTFGKLVSYTQLHPTTDIYPSIIMKNAYVFLGYFNVTQQQSAVFYDGDIVTYNYPLQTLNQEKNLIYSNGGSAIYK